MSRKETTQLVEKLCLIHEKTKAELKLEKTKNRILKKELEEKDRKLSLALSEG